MSPETTLKNGAYSEKPMSRKLKINYMKKVTITCAHCSGMFTISVPTIGVSSRGHQHSPGCGKITHVDMNSGNIVRTRT